MDVQSILRATFAVPAIEPEWQRGLLQQLASIETAGAAANRCETGGPAVEPARKPGAAGAAAGSRPPFVDMGQGSREQQYSRQKPVLRIVPPVRGR